MEFPSTTYNCSKTGLSYGIPIPLSLSPLGLANPTDQRSDSVDSVGQVSSVTSQSRVS